MKVLKTGKVHILLFSFILYLVYAVNQECQYEEIPNNLCRQNEVIKTVSATLKTCKSICDDLTGCEAFIFRRNQQTSQIEQEDDTFGDTDTTIGACEFKSGSSSSMTSCTHNNGTTFQSACISAYTKRTDGRCRPGDMLQMYTGLINECESLCTSKVYSLSSSLIYEVFNVFNLIFYKYLIAVKFRM